MDLIKVISEKNDRLAVYFARKSTQEVVAEVHEGGPIAKYYTDFMGSCDRPTGYSFLTREAAEAFVLKTLPGEVVETRTVSDDD